MTMASAVAARKARGTRRTRPRAGVTRASPARAARPNARAVRVMASAREEWEARERRGLNSVPSRTRHLYDDAGGRVRFRDRRRTSSALRDDEPGDVPGGGRVAVPQRQSQPAPGRKEAEI